MTAASRGRLDILQAGRGLAAFAVAMSHARLGTGAFAAPLPAAIEGVLAQGYLGVDFFFVLSGFIILHVHEGDPETGLAALRYAAKRLLRVFVPYLPVTAAVVAAYTLFPALSQAGGREWGWLTTWTLLPSSKEPALVAAWTLVHEMMFYGVFLVFFVSRKLFACLIGAWSLALLQGLAVPRTYGTPALTVLLHPINLEFVFGLLCAWGLRVLSRRQGHVALALGIGAVGVFFAGLNAAEAYRVVFGLGAALIVLGLTLSGARAAGPLARLGDASYALYLLHNPVISLTSRAAGRIGVLGNWPASLAFSAVMTVLAALAYHRTFERPALSRARGLIFARLPAE